MVDSAEVTRLVFERPAPRLSFGDRCRDRRDRWLNDLRERISLLTIGRVATVVGSVLVVAAAGLWLLRPPMELVETSIPRPSSTVEKSGVTPSLSTNSAASGREIVVQIAGAIARPGVFRVADGARVVDLVTLAGGTVDGIDESILPLAQKLVDGQRIYVARPGETVVPVMVDPGGGADAPAGPVNLNSATVGQLDGLPGVGPATATAIVNYREKHGPFRSVAGLLEVPGIGDAKLEALRDQVTV